MYLSICGDPDCPNERKVNELEKEVIRLKQLLKSKQEEIDDLSRQIQKLSDQFKYVNNIKEKYGH